MSPAPLYYALPDAAWTLRFDEEALSTVLRHVQRGLWSKESVGQLYTYDLTGHEIVVARATVLTPTRASWAKVRFDTAGAMRERALLFAQGLHCLGLWHTHPEARPIPSGEDRALAREHAIAARAQLTGLVFAILGTANLPRGFRVWVDDRQVLREALPTRAP